MQYVSDFRCDLCQLLQRELDILFSLLFNLKLKLLDLTIIENLE